MRQWGVNNLPKVVAQQRHAGARTHDPWIASPTPYRLATAPPQGHLKWRGSIDHVRLSIGPPL